MSVTKHRLITPTMRDALVLLWKSICRRVVPTGGGFWQVGEVTVPWSTTTVYALEDRGLLRKMERGVPRWTNKYELTGCGRMIAQAIVEERW